MIQIGVVGAGRCSQEVEALAEEVGREIARRDACLLCGGLGGVMEAAARGARAEGGLTVGIIPGPEIGEANPFVKVVIATDMGHARNVILVRSCHAIIAIHGSYGTLSEISLALKMGKPVVGLETWDIGPHIIKASGPKDAVERAFDAIEPEEV